MTADNPPISDPKSTMQLWKEGARMDNAPDIFGITRGLTKIRKKARDDARSTASTGKESFLKAGKDATAFYDALEPVLATFNENANVRAAKEDRLIERLQAGELIAFGFPVHETDASIPVVVPIFMFERDFAKWRKRSFIGHDRIYANVKICEFPVDREPDREGEIGDTKPETEITRPADKTAPSKRGPKPHDDMIADAIANLKLNDVLFDGMSQQKQIFEIQAKVAELYPARFRNGAQPGRSTIRRFLIRA